jgi:hypothetical protein
VTRPAARQGTLFVAVGVAVLSATAPRHALAVDKVACMSAAESAEDLRKAGKLLEARDKLLVCSQPACPAFVRSDCKSWLNDVTGALTSVAIHAERRGQVLTDVVVKLDGATVATTLAGTAPWTSVDVNPGLHSFRFEHADDPPVEESVTLTPGTKLREIDVQFAPQEAAAPPPSPPTPPAPAPPAARPVPVPVYVVGGAGVVITGVATFFQVSGMSKVSGLNSCKPDCSVASRNDARTTLWVGNVGLGVGVLTLATAAVLFIRRPTVEAQPVGAVAVDVEPTRGGFVGLVTGSFGGTPW